MSDDLTGSALSHLECSRTGTTYDADVVQGVSEVGAPLLARYDLERVRDSVSPGDIAGREPTLWRYRELLPVREPANVVTLGEGMTPLLPLPAYGAAVGVPGLLMKDEGALPTGSFKARGAAVGVARAPSESDRVVVLNTGTGLIYPGTVPVDVPVLGRQDAITH